MSMDDQHDSLLQIAAVAAGAALTAASTQALAQTKSPATEAQAFGKMPPWELIYHLDFYIGEGKLQQWENYWGGTQVPTLEKRTGQALWAGWSSLSGRENMLTHNWAYRDLAHYQSAFSVRREPGVMGDMRNGAESPPILGSVTTTVMEKLSYHPTVSYPDMPQKKTGIIATHRITTSNSATGAGPKEKDHANIMVEFIQAAAKHGALLVGGFRSWTGLQLPTYQLQVWRYDDMKQYWNARAAIEADPECRKMLAAMRGIFPQEIIELNRPLSYSRLR